MKKLLGFIIFFGCLFITNNASSDEISLRDVERYCEVYMYSKNYGDVECRKSRLRIVERKCEGYLYSGSKYGEIDCRGSQLRKIERRCEFYMYSKRYGEIDC